MSDTLDNAFDKVVGWISGAGLYALLVFAAAFVVQRLLRIAIRRIAKRFAAPGEAEGESEKRARALASVLSSTASVAVYAVAIVSILDRFGFRTASLLASLGVVGLAVGFGAQTLVRDLVSGFFMLAEGQLAIGDSVRVYTASGPIKGTVEKLSLRTTVIRGQEGEAQIIPNGEIRFISNFSREWAKAVVDVVTDPASVDSVGTIIRSVAQQLSKEEGWEKDFLGEPEYLGVEHIDKDGVTLRLVAPVKPSRQAAVKREITSRVLAEMASMGLIGTSASE